MSSRPLRKIRVDASRYSALAFADRNPLTRMARRRSREILAAARRQRRAPDREALATPIV
jgi:hypothetical protein